MPASLRSFSFSLATSSILPASSSVKLLCILSQINKNSTEADFRKTLLETLSTYSAVKIFVELYFSKMASVTSPLDKSSLIPLKSSYILL